MQSIENIIVPRENRHKQLFHPMHSYQLLMSATNVAQQQQQQLLLATE
jgi:hypothetical protein